MFRIVKKERLNPTVTKMVIDAPFGRDPFGTPYASAADRERGENLVAWGNAFAAKGEVLEPGQLDCRTFTTEDAMFFWRFGAELTARLSYPFFALTRAMRVFGSVEHFEALAAAVWVLPDYVLVSALLAAASRTLMTTLGYVCPAREPKLYDMKNGRFIIPLCAAGALLASAFIAPDAKSLKFFSETLIPYLNMGVIFILLPLCLAVGKIRKKI